MKLGLIGYGSIARSLIGMLPDEPAPQITVLVRPASLSKALQMQAENAPQPTINFVTSRDALLASRLSLVVECAGHSAIVDHAEQIVAAGTDIVTASVGAFADASLHARVSNTAETNGAKLIIPTGAIGGLDLLHVLSANNAVHVTYRGIKPPAAWKGSPAEKRVNLDSLQERTVFFTGTGRAAALEFPKNANVVAALALAGAGFDDMTVELIADPKAQTNVHAYEVTSPLCSYKMEIENAANSGNARTSATTVLSILQEVMRHQS
jgi:aspartate dehydrogenase